MNICLNYFEFLFSIFFSCAGTQGHREKFRAPGQKFSLDPLVSGAPKSREEQKKGHSVRRCSNFGPKSSDEQKMGHSLRRCSNFGSTSSDEQNKVIASADVRTSARNNKKYIIASAGRSLS